MIQVYTLPLGAYQTNCYFLSDRESGKCIVIDPGYEPERILAFLKEKRLHIQAVFLTHGHFDHVGAVRALIMDFDCPVYLHPADTAMPPQLTDGPLYYTHPLSDGQAIPFGCTSIQVLHTPGHTPGSVCFAVGDFLFTGDTLFAGSCGRTDLPGGSWEVLTASLARLKKIDFDYRILPGHGGSSTLNREKTQNPYLRG